MISVIMPTMWKPEGVLDRIKEIVQVQSVSELILIDNTDDGVEINEYIPKLVHIKEKKNTFVNPAWNKGVEIAKENKLLIVNDDVYTDWSIIDLVDEHITPEKGIIGAGESCWKYSGGQPSITFTPFRMSCYGCLMFIHKDSYSKIPDSLKIHHGDDWIFMKSNKPNFQIINWKMWGESEQTSGQEKFNSIKNQDTNQFNKLFEDMKNEKRKKWVVYCAGNSEYILSENSEPLKMLKSFQKHFGDEIDYVYLTDKNEENLNLVEELCSKNNIKLITGSIKENYKKYLDVEFINSGKKGRWPDAMYWYCDGPIHLINQYEYAIKCDGDVLCNKKFDLNEFETEFAITISKEPDWYNPFDKYCPNAGVQFLNLRKYLSEQIYLLFRVASENVNIFNSDTPALDYFIKSNKIIVNYISADYNYLLFDVDEVIKLNLDDVSDVKIFHFVGSKPHNLSENMIGSVKEHFSKIYLNY